jgi:DNA-binding response OmpR family regulator
MGVTPLPSRPGRIHPDGNRRGITHRRTIPLNDSAALTVTVEVTLSGARRLTDAEVLETLRQVTDRFAVARNDFVRGQAGADRTSATPPSRSSHIAAAHEPARTEPAERERAEPGHDDMVRIVPDSREVWLRGERVGLTRVEYDLLHFLALHPRRVFTRGQLLESVWGFAHGGPRTVDVHIRRLRAKLGISRVTTVRGFGYRLADDAMVQLLPH